VSAKWAVNQASINQQDVAHTAVPLPPEAEQVRLVAEIDRLFSAATVVAATVERATRRAVRLRQGVLKWAFEGKLVDPDPSDEPADKLLARIQAERAALSPTKKNSVRQA
jgi:type I restriction enzyme S subunit